MVEEIGRIAGVERRNGNSRIIVEARKVMDGLKLGDSIAVDGVCLTVVAFTQTSFQVEATKHTVATTTLGDYATGRFVNLEAAMRLGDRLGGHMVQGHVDGVGKVGRINYREGSTEIHLHLERHLQRLMTSNGSVAVNGVSLTIAEKTPRGIKLVIIPTTLEMTILGDLTPGNKVNIETDLIIRWIADQYDSNDNNAVPERASFEGGSFHLED